MKHYHDTDPEFAERFEHFAFDEVVNEKDQQLDEITRHMAITATLIGCQGIDAFQREVPRALDAGLTPVMLKEIVYQAVDYLGIGRVLPFLDAANDILHRKGRQPSPGRSGDHYDGRPPGKRRTGTGRNFWRTYEGSMENRPYQSLACG